MSLVPPDATFALWGTLFAGAAVASWAERTRVGRRVSGVLVSILLAMVLSNLRLIPLDSPTYDVALEYLIPISIPLLLFDANLRRIVRDTGRMLAAFGIGVVGTIAGALAGVYLVPLGPTAPELAGVFSSTYIGGGLNFVAVAQATGFTDGTEMAASVAADNFVTALYIMAVMALPSVVWLRRRIPSRIADRAAPSDGSALAGPPPPALRVAALASALALAFGIAALGRGLAGLLHVDGFSILFISALALFPANVAPRLTRRLTGHAEAGMMGIYIFLFVLGAKADLWGMVGSALPITAFALVVVFLHMGFVLLVGGWLRFDLAELVIASNACVGGSASAGPIAAARGWHELMTPAILCGALGNAVGTFIGVGLTALLRSVM